ncbi:radical SAM protein [Halosquirtibacter xylanolyticus]|uniref:radical SAM protein n=1 Tax=Halosquirtibacter xylanolyticus TaxID=3374599 RepID=UPI003748DC2F|nr:radical SAM protein [Prolixibacteraceae bacterium]
MATFLFDKTIFGPIKSRRLGISLGVNLLPNDQKLCSFDCIYCECGWNPKERLTKPVIPTSDEVKELLEKQLLKMSDDGELPDVITFAGNGEPTLHPQFKKVIEDTIALRDKYCPKAKVAVLTNSTTSHRKDVVEALKMVDDNIMKLDGGTEEIIQAIDQPVGKFDIKETIEVLKQFNGDLIIQTLFMRGEFEGESVDNTSIEEVDAWIECVKEIHPRQVMIYSLDRDTPAQGLIKVEKDDLEKIATYSRTKLDDDILITVS